MTSGSWRLTTAVRSFGTFTPTNGVKAVPLLVTRGQTQSLAYGTGSGQANLHVVTLRTILAGADATLNLYDGSLLDVHGQAAAFRKLRAVVVRVVSGGDASGVDVGEDGVVTNPCPLFLKGTTPRATVFPSGPAFSAGSPAGATVSNTAKNLLLHNSGAATVVVEVALAGSTV